MRCWTIAPLRRWLIAPLLLVALVGCGQDGAGSDARATVARFYDTLAQGRTGAACSQLTAAAVAQLESQSGEPCERAVVELRPQERPTVSGAHVYVTSAHVSLRDGESAFLDREPEGWRLSAIGCEPTEGPPTEVPLDCELEG